MCYFWRLVLKAVPKTQENPEIALELTHMELRQGPVATCPAELNSSLEEDPERGSSKTNTLKALPNTRAQKEPWSLHIRN